MCVSGGVCEAENEQVFHDQDRIPIQWYYTKAGQGWKIPKRTKDNSPEKLRARQAATSDVGG